MAPPIRTARLSMEAFPECPAEFRPTLEKLLGILAEQSAAVAQALNGNLTRSENMRSKYLTATGVPGASGTLVVRVRHQLPETPRAVWAHKLTRADNPEFFPVTWVLNRWRPLQGGVIEVALRNLTPNIPHTVHLVVE